MSLLQNEIHHQYYQKMKPLMQSQHEWLFSFYKRKQRREETMIVIQTQNDIEYLKAINTVPMDLIKVIEQDFLDVLEAEGVDKDDLSYRLPSQQAFVLLEVDDDVSNSVGDLLHIEYIEKLTENNIDYYRIAKRFDHEFQLLYTLAGIHDEKSEQWLNDHAE
ncbi:hypothetical protein J2Z37_002294 [Ammoniphilus resinae]|uniref:Uncharacterized protein n=1 Tax=Ammoniphilus resinae TaxID=861532 RepID=A0ABS4GPU8_9BACL|nr:hypothetical protein [Ammoniphilus resinae]